MSWMHWTVSILFSTLIWLNFGHDCPQVKYVPSAVCQGQRGTNYLIVSSDGVSPTECAQMCEGIFYCLLFFYNPTTRLCSLHNRTLPDIDMVVDMDSSCFIADDVEESWITSIVNVTSFYNDTDGYYPATAMIGEPDAYPSPNDSTNAWCPMFLNKRDNFVFRMATEMYIEQVHIYEIYEPGGVQVVRLVTPEDTWYVAWNRPAADLENLSGVARIMALDLEITTFKTSVIRISIGKRFKWEEIDAVKVIGKKQRMSQRGTRFSDS